MRIVDKKKVLHGIYFLKMNELKELLEKRGLPISGTKQTLIDRLLVHHKIKMLDPIYKKRKKKLSKVSSKTHIIKGVYRNNQEYRAVFKDMIGEHFKFTSYGMNWIKEHWSNGYSPSYIEFCTYWQDEYLRRKNGGKFISAETNRRVVFFRENKGLSLAKLNSLWIKERKTVSSKVILILNSLL